MKLDDLLSVRVSDYCLRLYCFFHTVSAAVSSSLPQVSPIYLGIEIIQPGKLFFKFDWRIQRPRCCRKNNKDEDNSPKTLTDKKKKYACLIKKRRWVASSVMSFKQGHRGFQVFQHNTDICQWLSQSRFSDGSSTFQLCCFY